LERDLKEHYFFIAVLSNGIKQQHFWIWCLTACIHTADQKTSDL